MKKARDSKSKRESIHKYPKKPTPPDPPEGETVVCQHEHSPDRPIEKYVAFKKYYTDECIALGRKGCTEPGAQCSGIKKGGMHGE